MQMAQAQIDMMVNRQAAMLSYIDDFMLLAILFAAVIPFIFLMKKPPSVHGPGAGGH
jgi:DHA2 family multidrug resistance protein